MTAEGPLFSVLVATYGRPSLLREAIDSVLAQTIEDFECIVVDDAGPGTTEGSQDPRVRVVRRTTNGGQGAAYNTGLDHARGKYVAFLDDDDLFTADRLALALRGFERGVPVVVCRSQVLGAPAPGPASRPALEGDVNAVIRERIAPNVGQTAVERSLVPRFDERFRASADIEWWIRLAQAAHVTSVDEVGLLFRRHDGIRHGNDGRARIDAQLLMLEIHGDYFASHPRAAAFQWKRIGIKAARGGEHREALHSFARSFRLHPRPRTLWHLGSSLAGRTWDRTVRVSSLLTRVQNNKDLPAAFVSSLTATRRSRAHFDEIEAYCMFIGYPRSGHSLLGSLLDAHPEAVVAHELDALRYFQARFSRNQVFSLILDNERRYAAKGRSSGVYHYAVPNQWQGRFERLRVIGDKKGGRSTRRMLSDPRLLDRVRHEVALPMRFVHVTRNPYDNISTMFGKKKGRHRLEATIDEYFGLCAGVSQTKAASDDDELLDVRHEDLLADPDAVLRRVCGFLGLEAGTEYVRDCAGILFSSPKQTRHSAPWNEELIERVGNQMESFPFLAGYSFEH